MGKRGQKEKRELGPKGFGSSCLSLILFGWQHMRKMRASCEVSLCCNVGCQARSTFDISSSSGRMSEVSI